MATYTLRCVIKGCTVATEKEKARIKVRPLDVVRKYGSKDYLGIMQGSDSTLVALSLSDGCFEFPIDRGVMSLPILPCSCRALLELTFEKEVRTKLLTSWTKQNGWGNDIDIPKLQSISWEDL